MKTTVKLRHIKQSATKVRFVLKQVTGLSVSKALDRLRFANKKASVFIYKALNSGISNLSTLNDNVDKENLYIIDAYVDQGPTMKRFRPRAMGRATPIRKRSSHLTITISDNKG